MKRPTQLLTLIGATLAISFSAFGATITSETKLHLKADPNSPVIATLPAGTSVHALMPDELKAEMLNNLPDGWIAIRHAGPVYGYAPNTAVGKNLFLKPGSIIRTDPSPTAMMITMVGEKDSAELIEVIGDWSKVLFTKSLVGFIHPAAAHVARQSSVDPPVPAAPVPASAAAPVPASAPALHPPAGPSSSPVEAQESTFIDATPRVFQGYLMRTRRMLGVGPKLDYQLVDEAGRRIALLDLSALLITEPLERYENRNVSIFGPVSRRDDLKDMIIRVETLRLNQ
ncbi:MAG TPA: hypothetical protein VGA56_02100 [Opitutaceae bacterium]